MLEMDRASLAPDRPPTTHEIAIIVARFASRQDDSPVRELVAALRNPFGGHAVETA